MSGAYIASGKHEVFNIFGVERAQRDAVRLGQALFLKMCAVLAAHCKAAGEVVVYLPAAVCDLVGELSAVFNIVLREYVIAYVAAALALAGQEADKVKLPIFGAVVAAVFHVIPDAEGDLQQLVARRFGVVNGIRLASKLYPVEVGVDLVKALVRLEFHLLIGIVAVCPVGSGKWAGVIGLVRLYHKAHAHCFAVGFGKSEFLAEL